ncbi:Cell division protein kinase 2 homolog CRK1 [Geodia barretti]|uniref:Cell division protein kinase 2 homolog CRK1 n=1 Tax=Geodia barretti TaxID=519541 RepID=A0AA35SM23_GEOBA|nr:Cell division protein kinase 2 homolog CRK1 [Geodia barretti]
MMELEGHVLGSRYKVQRKIQSGYFGTTWTARDLTTRGTVCVKTFICDSENQRKELAVLKELCDGHFNHENICSILDVCVKKSPVTTVQGELIGSLRFVVFEYCSGSDLFNFLVTGPFERIKT